MLIDRYLQFSKNQAVTASAASTNIVDNQNARNIGVCSCLKLVVTCTADMTDVGSDSTVTPSLRTSATAASGALTDTINTLMTLPTFPAGTKAGTQFVVPLPPAAYLEFFDVYYTVANGNLTTGSFSAQIVHDADIQQFYPVGYSVS